MPFHVVSVDILDPPSRYRERAAVSSRRLGGSYEFWRFKELLRRTSNTFSSLLIRQKNAATAENEKATWSLLQVLFEEVLLAGNFLRFTESKRTNP